MKNLLRRGLQLLARQLASAAYLGRGFLFRLRRSPLAFWFWTVDRLCDGYFDGKFGIRSSERRSLLELGIDLPQCIHYQPVSYTDFVQLLGMIQIVPNKDVFLDFGSGMGRAVCLAARYPFRSVIGVELSSELCGIAHENVNAVRPKLRCQNIRIENLNATEYCVPLEVSVIFFFHPFHGQVFERVLHNVAASIREHPRRLSVLFYGAGMAPGRKELRNCDWLFEESEIILRTGNIGVIFKNCKWTGDAEWPAAAATG